MDNYLVISALGRDRPGIVNELSKAILDYGCNIVDSRMTVLGGEFAIILMVSGHWNQIAKMEAALPKFEANLGLVVTSRRTVARKVQPDLIPYDIEVVAIDHPGIVHQLTNFFSTRHINIEDLSTGSYYAAAYRREDVYIEYDRGNPGHHVHRRDQRALFDLLR